MAKFLYGSICLTEVPKELFKRIKCKDGVERVYLNIKVVERREKGKYDDTHFISCEPKQDERKDGVNYVIGNLKTFDSDNHAPSTEDIASASSANDDQLPF